MIGSILRTRYELTGLVADGPVFSTYSARDRQAGRDVAVRLVKAPFSRDTAFIDRLRETVAKYKALGGGNVEPISAVEQDDLNAFLVGELTRGPSLGDRIRKLAPFSIQVSVATALSLCGALDPLHRSGVAHGDLNPGNIAVLADGDVRLQLTGIWEAYSGSATAAAMVLPTMSPYLAPEVSAGEMPSPRSDVYAVGVLLYELLSGRLPYYAETPVAMALQHANAPTPSVRTVNPSVPAVLDEIVKKAMSKAPEQRYGSAGELAADLRQLQDALRFGRQLTWPLRSSAATAAAAAPATQRVKVTPQPQRVAPRMPAIRPEDEEEDRPRRERAERDVPVWMLVLFTFVAAVALGLFVAWMLMNLNKPRTVAVPDLKGLSVAEAKAVLKDSKLDLKVSGREPNDRVEADHVIEVSPEVGERIREGAQVSVTVSAGARYVAVPDLQGLTVDKAKTLLSNVGLELDPTIEKVSNGKVSPDLIVKTVPSPRSKVERQTRVKVYVSSGASGEARVGMAPDETDQGNLYTLHLRLRDLVKPTQVRIEMVDGDETKVIFDQEKMPGDEFDVNATGKSKEAEFRFYYDDQLVKTLRRTADGGQSEE